ncbi:MAG: hypothetical protein ACXWT3_06355 [Methylococcaceae bacterium]
MNFFDFSEQTWLSLDHYGIFLGDILMTATLLGGVYGFINRNDLRNWLTRNRFPGIGGNPEHTHWQGVVFTVSCSDVSNWVIDQVQPASIGLLVTDFKREDGEKIRQKAEQSGINVYTKTINDPDDPAEVKLKTKELLQKLRDCGVNDIAVDITGGKTPMSLGAFMAAEECSCDSIYVTTGYKDKKPDMSTANIKAISQAPA